MHVFVLRCRHRQCAMQRESLMTSNRNWPRERRMNFDLNAREQHSGKYIKHRVGHTVVDWNYLTPEAQEIYVYLEWFGCKMWSARMTNNSAESWIQIRQAEKCMKFTYKLKKSNVFSNRTTMSIAKPICRIIEPIANVCSIISANVRLVLSIGGAVVSQ